MPKTTKGSAGHTGKTSGGNTKDIKVDRIGQVTIYKRGKSFYLYYRENKKSERQRVEGNLAVARATAAKVSAALTENRPSPLGFERSSPQALREGFLDYVEKVQQLAWRTQDRYRAALDRFIEFCEADDVRTIDSFQESTVEDFVRWLRGQTRTRNGAKKGKREVYAVGGVKFILSACRTAFNWASRRRMLPPYSENPFTRFPIDQMRDADGQDEGSLIFTTDQQRAFFAACDEWQRGIFLTLVTYGLRVGELTNLLIENVDFTAGTIQICSKPELYWRVKTSRRRMLPLTKETRELIQQQIGDRKAGFVFLNEEFASGTKKARSSFSSDRAFRENLKRVADDYSEQHPDSTEKDLRRLITANCRAMGQIPVKRVQHEFCKLTEKIGCPEFTRAHDLRHLFSSRAQEEGMNPILVQELLGHASLTMTKRYTHLGMEAKREALERINTSADVKET